jgi:hypothetical protein
MGLRPKLQKPAGLAAPGACMTHFEHQIFVQEVTHDIGDGPRRQAGGAHQFNPAYGTEGAHDVQQP